MLICCGATDHQTILTLSAFRGMNGITIWRLIGAEGEGNEIEMAKKRTRARIRQVSMAIATILGSLDQLLDLGGGQVFAGA